MKKLAIYAMLLAVAFSTACGAAGAHQPIINKIAQAEDGTLVRTVTRTDIVVQQLEGKLLTVEFLDVRQGDAILITTPGGKIFLLDSGNRSARRVLIPMFKNRGITKLDGVIISHAHLDHVGGLKYLADVLQFDRMWFSGHFHSNNFNDKLLEKLDKKGVKLLPVRSGDSIELEEGLKVAVLNPGKKWNPDLYNPNNFSVVLRLSYGDIDFMLTGDAERRAEKRMLKSHEVLEAEVLKLGHHGSETATTGKFLDKVVPLFGIVSCGPGNSFRHPHEPTMAHMKARNIKVYRTDQDGSILMKTDGHRIFIEKRGKKGKEEPLTFLAPAGHDTRTSLWIIHSGGNHA